MPFSLRDITDVPVHNDATIAATMGALVTSEEVATHSVQWNRSNLCNLSFSYLEKGSCTTFGSTRIDFC